MFSKIWSFIKGVGVKISDAFKKIFGEDAATKFAEGAVVLLKTAAGVIALDVVKAVQLSNPLATPAEKREAAFQQIASDAKAQGISLSSSLINLLIELAVQSILKQSFVPK